MSQLIKGDCLEELQNLEDNSVEAIVTDPPYGYSFMGKKWDYEVPGVDIWKECLRVLKPGGHILAFAGTRTQHRMAVNIEDAGFEIRDMIAWVYGSGFPKNHNIGKAVDKVQGNEREFIGYGKLNPKDKKTYKPKASNESFNLNKGMEQMKQTKGSSEWEGWGTALKPALEPITLARKPFKDTVANNVLKYGTGGINIDECRINYESEDDINRARGRSGNYGNMGKESGNKFNIEFGTALYKSEINKNGRFPANFIHDGSDEVEAGFPETKTNSIGSALQKGKIEKKNKKTNTYSGGWDLHVYENDYADSGSASRFFYCAKATKKERGASNNHPTVKPIKLIEYLVKLISKEGQTILDPFAGSGTTGIACKNLNRDYILIERDEEYHNIIKERLNNHIAEPELFE